MLHRKILTPLILGAMALGLSAGTALAQESQPDQSMQPASQTHKQDMKTMHKSGNRMHRMRMEGRHMMPATVTSVDKKTGKVAVNSGGMDLMVHFPPASLANVNKGDKITLMLGFRMGDTKPMGKEHKMHKDMKQGSMEHEH